MIDSITLTIADQAEPSVGSAPATPHRAYCAGLQASRDGRDLADVMLDGLRTWRIDIGLAGLAELLACAAIGWTASEWQGTGEVRP